MASLNLDLDYFEHPKTLRLIGLLGRGAEVLPIRLWAYCGKYHPKDGRLAGYGAQEIESLLKWWGGRGQMIPAMEKCGFVRRDKKGYLAHDWEEWQGHIWALKERNTAAAKKRWAKLALSDANGGSTVDTTGIRHAYQNDASGMPQPTNQLSVGKEPTEKDVGIDNGAFGDKSVDKSTAAPTAPTSLHAQLCSYNDHGQGRCFRPRSTRSKFCDGHKLKVHEKFMSKDPKLKGLPELKDVP